MASTAARYCLVNYRSAATTEILVQVQSKARAVPATVLGSEQDRPHLLHNLIATGVDRWVCID